MAHYYGSQFRAVCVRRFYKGWIAYQADHLLYSIKIQMNIRGSLMPNQTIGSSGPVLSIQDLSWLRTIIKTNYSRLYSASSRFQVFHTTKYLVLFYTEDAGDETWNLVRTKKVFYCLATTTRPHDCVAILKDNLRLWIELALAYQAPQP